MRPAGRYLVLAHTPTRNQCGTLLPPLHQLRIQCPLSRLALFHAAPEARRMIHVPGVRQLMATAGSAALPAAGTAGDIERDHAPGRTASPARALATHLQGLATEPMLARQLLQQRIAAASCARFTSQRSSLPCHCSRVPSPASLSRPGTHLAHARQAGAAAMEQRPAFADALRARSVAAESPVPEPPPRGSAPPAR